MSSLKERLRRRDRKRQLKINSSLKKRLYKDMVFAPCCYCKAILFIEHLTIEHLVPRCLGGTNEDINISLACAPCNREKGREAWFIKKAINAKQYQIKVSNEK